jgi:hypothetical protein
MGNGEVRCWGNNSLGQLGDGTKSPTPSKVPVVVGSLAGATAIAAGIDHTCALLTSHAIKCWGYNLYGQLGDNTRNQSSTPVNVVGINTAIAIVADANYTCALLANGTVKCWGDNRYGLQSSGLPLDSSTPVTVGGLSGVTSISAGRYHACARLANGTAKCWGTNGQGANGNGPWDASALVVPGLSGVRQPTITSTVPWAPASPKATPGNHTAKVTWKAPANGGSTITDYVVQFSSNSGATWTTFRDGVHATTSATVTGLTNGKAYVFRVAAKNARGTGLFGPKSVAVKPR